MTYPYQSCDQTAMSIKDFCLWARIGRTTAYKQISSGRLQIRKVGRRSIILLPDAQRWLDSLPCNNHIQDSLKPIETLSL